MAVEILAPEPIAKRNVTLQIVTPTRSGGGGTVGTSRNFEIRGGARARYSFEIPAMRTDDACKVRAWLHACRGGGTYTVLRLPPSGFALQTTAVDEVLAGASRAVLASAAGVVPGQYAVIGNVLSVNAATQIVHIRAVVGSQIEFSPEIRVTHAAGVRVRIGDQLARFRLMGTPTVPLRPERSEPFMVEFEEVI